MNKYEKVGDCGCRLERVESGLQMIDCPLHSAASDMLEALKGLFEHCAMVHKHWGDGDNTKQADAAIKAGEAAIRTAEGRQ